MERYDPARNAWVKVKPMSVGRRSPGVVAHRGKLYAVGGMGEKEDLRSVEVYDPIVNRWSKLPHTMREICGEQRSSRSARSSSTIINNLYPVSTTV